MVWTMEMAQGCVEGSRTNERKSEVWVRERWWMRGERRGNWDALLVHLEVAREAASWRAGQSPPKMWCTSPGMVLQDGSLQAPAEPSQSLLLQQDWYLPERTLAWIPAWRQGREPVGQCVRRGWGLERDRWEVRR